MGFNFNNSLEELTELIKVNIPMGIVYWSMRTRNAISKGKIYKGQSPGENRSRFTVVLSHCGHEDSDYFYQEHVHLYLGSVPNQEISLKPWLPAFYLGLVKYISRADCLHGWPELLTHSTARRSQASITWSKVFIINNIVKINYQICSKIIVNDILLKQNI